MTLIRGVPTCEKADTVNAVNIIDCNNSLVILCFIGFIFNCSESRLETNLTTFSTGKKYYYPSTLVKQHVLTPKPPLYFVKRGLKYSPPSLRQQRRGPGG
jgi:hypothetical protein